MTKHDDAALLAENERLRAEVERLRSHCTVWDKWFWLRECMPSEAEATKIFEMIVQRYPQMCSKTDDFLAQVRGFIASIAYVATLKQTDKPEERYSGGVWGAQAQDWANSKEVQFMGRIRTLVPAIIALDVPYVLDHNALYLDPDRQKGRPIDPLAWRKLLVAGAQLKEPLKIERRVRDSGVGFVHQIPTAW